MPIASGVMGKCKKKKMKRKLLIILTLILTIFIVGLIFFNFSDNVPLDKSISIDKILVEKSKRQLHVYSKGELIKTYKISLGREPIGKKQFEGDKKTPEGLYYINGKNSASGYYKNLGVSYPNAEDIKYAEKMKKSPGGLIKIHGLRNGLGWIGKNHLFFDWTMGCIALTNEDVEELYNCIEIGTPIEIKP